jgi:hypothetical protein
MKNYTDEELRKFIRNNKDTLIDGCRPVIGHEEKFLRKLQARAKKFIDLTPYLVKVAIATILIFVSSMFVWYSFMRPDPTKTVIENVIEQFKKK